MAATQPLTPPASLRIVPPRAEHEVVNFSSAPVFDIQPPVADIVPFAPFRFDEPSPDLAPFSFDDLDNLPDVSELPPIADLLTDEDTVSQPVAEPEQHHAPGGTGELTPRQTGYLNGVSLSAVLQMLHLERKTCAVEVSAHGWLGTLTLVNGELVDASIGDMVGEDAAYTILNWTNPQTSIMDGVDLFRHTVQRPITQLIMDAVRIGDETGLLNPANLPEHDRDDIDAPQPVGGDWLWLVESMTMAGARNVRVLGPHSLGGGELRTTGLLGTPAIDLARALRTWSALLGPDCTEVIVTRSDHIVVLAVLDPDRTEYIYAEASGPETAELIRRSLRSIQRHH
ncbi:MAG: DUF4388 domain-containing protein [Chloroflexota bacterium]|jgi:hypothetical protein|nr:DUF4388 domain-containing protein [Chloroflexota bacterium]